MTIPSSDGRSRARRPLFAALFLSSAAVLAGCMSADQPTTDFGFSTGDNLAEIAEGSDVALDDGAAAEPGTQSADPAEATQTAALAEGETAEPSVEAVAQPAEQPAAETTVPPTSSIAAQVAAAAPAETAAPSAAVAAFASPAANRSDRSLYASLFTEAEARTPIKNTDAAKASRVVVTRTDGAGKAQKDGALPGVDPSSLFQIGQRASADSEDLLEDIGGAYQVASLSGLARLAPNGLLVQRDDIVTNCFGSDLVSLLRQVERRFGKKVVITSGYRSPSHNRKVNGAKASMHMACKAADLHVPGVDGKQVASFVRALPGRGGVGTYCHTAAIHVDTGPKRDWNWACRRRQQS